MEIGTSKLLRSIFRMLDDEETNNMYEFSNSCSDRYFRTFEDEESAVMCTESTYSEEASEILRDYSGIYYKWINAIARDNWNYEEHGHIENKVMYENMPDTLRKAIDENQRTIGNVKVFRGVTLSYFSDYGITSLKDLESLKGGFLIDKGFVSTSLLEKSCFYKKQNDYGLNYNVKIEYLVPEEFEDGVSIGSVSYSPGQNEYLINAWNIARVVDVRMDGNDGAVLSALLIPKKVYDKGYRNRVENSK